MRTSSWLRAPAHVAGTEIAELGVSEMRPAARARTQVQMAVGVGLHGGGILTGPHLDPANPPPPSPVRTRWPNKLAKELSVAEAATAREDAVEKERGRGASRWPS